VQFVAPVIVDFLARYPQASVDLWTGHVMIDWVQEAFDLAISARPGQGHNEPRLGRNISCESAK